MSALSWVAPERLQDPQRYAIGGSVPGAALRPATYAEAAGAVRECSQRGLAIVPWGGGVSLSHESAPPPRYDLALDLRALDQVVVYEPDDYTVTAGCGITLAALGARLAEKGQELPVESAAPAAATLGGVLATNASGPRRLALGAPRDRILGARFVTGDGALAHTGGRVVKNVAGHAVHRMLVGSRGALGVMLEASLKLMPSPPARVALVHGMEAAALADLARWSGLPRREPAALTVLGRAAASAHPALATASAYTVVTGFEGDPAWVENCLAFTRERLGEPAGVLRGEAVTALWQALSDAAELPGPRLSFASAHNTPAALSLAAAHACGERLLFHAPAGRLHLWPEPQGAAELVRALASAGFALIESRGLDVQVPAPPAAVAALRARIAQAMDPAGVMAYGPRWMAGN